jgi:hypothetical protein
MTFLNKETVIKTYVSDALNTIFHSCMLTMKIVCEKKCYRHVNRHLNEFMTNVSIKIEKYVSV